MSRLFGWSFLEDALFFDLYLEFFLTAGAFDGVLALCSRQAQNRLAFRAGAEDVGGGVCGAVGLAAPHEPWLETKKGEILTAAFDHVARQTAEDRPNKKGKGDDVKSEGQVGENVGDHAEDGKDRT